jgi:hypothetical protein
MMGSVKQIFLLWKGLYFFIYVPFNDLLRISERTAWVVGMNTE